MKIAVLSDVHSNLEALDGCLAHARAQGAEQHICLGDVIGYGADPVAVVERLRALTAVVVVRGNHDDALFRDMGAFVSGGIRASIDWTRSQLSVEQREWFAGLPYQHAAFGATFVHASARDPAAWTYIWDCSAAEECMRAAGATTTFVGHTHVPKVYYEADNGLVRELDPVPGQVIPLSPRSRYVIGVGSVGQPRDGNSAACYCLFDDERRCVQFFRLVYDYHRTAEKIRVAGLDAMFADRLAEGY